MNLSRALQEILDDSALDGPSPYSIEAMAFAWREARRRLRQLQKAVEISQPPLEVRHLGDLDGYQVDVARQEISPAEISGAPLGLNFELRIRDCPRCRQPVDYVGLRRAWYCTNVDCARSARRRPSTLDQEPRPAKWRPGYSA